MERFLRPVSDCEFTLTSLLDELQRDSFPVSPEQRAARCTGAAIKVAAGLLAACAPDTGARIIGFVGGPCTEGPGVIVSKELSDPIRSHKDLAKDAAPHFNKAVKFYEGLAKQLVGQGHVLDLFACAVDQVEYSLPFFICLMSCFACSFEDQVLQGLMTWTCYFFSLEPSLSLQWRHE